MTVGKKQRLFRTKHDKNSHKTIDSRDGREKKGEIKGIQLYFDFTKHIHKPAFITFGNLVYSNM